MPQLSCLANPRCAGPKPARPPRRALGRWRTDHNAARAAPSRRMGRRRTSVRRGPPGPASSRDEAATATVRPCAVAHGSQHGQDRSLATRGPRMGEVRRKDPCARSASATCATHRGPSIEEASNRVGHEVNELSHSPASPASPLRVARLPRALLYPVFDGDEPYRAVGRWTRRGRRSTKASPCAERAGLALSVRRRVS